MILPLCTRLCRSTAAPICEADVRFSTTWISATRMSQLSTTSIHPHRSADDIVEWGRPLLHYVDRRKVLRFAWTLSWHSTKSKRIGGLCPRGEGSWRIKFFHNLTFELCEPNIENVHEKFHFNKAKIFHVK
jgi:hypothetical protein